MLLLQQFYQIYWQDNRPPAIALQQAQYWLRDATAKALMDFCNQVKFIVSGMRYDFPKPR